MNDERLLRQDWTLMIKTHNGHVSLLRNLTLKDAAKLYEAAETKRAPNVMYSMADSDVVQREIIGPDGWDGCKQAMQHSYSAVKHVCESGPYQGREYESGSCTHCGAHLFRWSDGLPTL